MEARITKAPPDVKAAVQLHDLRSASFVHTDFHADDCTCRQRRNGVEPFIRAVAAAEPAQPKRFAHDTGEACSLCGGLTVRSGTCTTCTSCGSTSGCS